METKQRIISEACTLFFSNGIRSVTMDDIAKHIGISKRTIYDNFNDKDELVRAVLEFHKEKMIEFRSDVIKKSNNFFEIIFTVLYFSINHFGKIHQSLFYDIKKYHSKIWDDLNSSEDKESLEMTIELLKQGQSQELIRDDINVEIVSIILNYQLKTISNEEVFSTDKFSKADVFKNIIVNFARGIASEKGIKIIDKLVKEKENELKNQNN